MWLHVVEEYQLWADRGYLTKYICRHHNYLKLIVSADHEGIYFLCPLGDYKYYISFGEYQDIEKKLNFAKLLFKGQ